MSSNPTGLPSAVDDSTNELNIRYVVLRILLQESKPSESQDEACRMVKSYLPDALTRYGHTISPAALELGTLAELEECFYTCAGILGEQKRSDKDGLRSLGEIIGGCEAGILAELGENGLKSRFGEELSQNRALSPDEVDIFRKGRGAGRFMHNNLRFSRVASHETNSDGDAWWTGSSQAATSTAGSSAGGEERALFVERDRAWRAHLSSNAASFFARTQSATLMRSVPETESFSAFVDANERRRAWWSEFLRDGFR